MVTSVDNLEIKTQNETISGIFFDGKQDKQTKVVRYNELTGRFHQGTISEEHYTLTWEPEGKYLHHFTKEPPTKGEKPALKIAQRIHTWLLDHGADDNLWMVSGDSTNTNSGLRGGVIAFLEKLLGHKVHWIICQIHVNELPLRHLIINLDGPYTHKSGFSYRIGKLLEKVDTLSVVHDFDPVEADESIIQLPDDVVANL